MAKKKKQKLDEGMVMISSLLPVGPKLTLSMRGDKPDNFVFKGLPGQFDKDGNKILDEYGEPLKDGSGKGQSLNKNRGGCADDEEINEGDSKKWNEIRLWFKNITDNAVSPEQQKLGKQGLALMKKLSKWV